MQDFQNKIKQIKKDVQENQQIKGQLAMFTMLNHEKNETDK